MADDILITVGANVKGVVTAIDTTKRLENRVKKLQTALDTGRVSSNQFDAALTKTSKSAKGYEKAVLDYANSLKAAKKAQDEAAAADQRAKQEVKAFVQARKEATEANRAFDAQRKRDIAAANQQAQEEERLRRKFIEGHAAMELYSKELNDLAVARKAGIITAEQQRQGLERLNQQMASGTGVFSGYGAVTQIATKRSNQLGVATQQAGYQIGDFLVQIQSGTNPMVAFGQQATQLVGVLPMVASQLGLSAKAAIGISTALGIGIPLFTAIAAAVGRFAIEALSASSGSKSFEDAMKALQEETEAAAIEVERLNRGLATTAQAKAGTEIDALRVKVKALGEAAKNADVEGSSFAFEALRIAEEELATAEKNLQANIDINDKKQQGLAIEKARADMQERTLAAAQALLDETEAAVAAVESVKDRVTALEKEYGKTVVQAALLAGLDIESGISLAAIAASNLSSEMKAALASALGLVDLSVKYGMMEGSAGAKRMRQYAGRGTVSDQEPIVGETGESIYKEPPKVRGSRGGGGKTEAERMQETIAKFEEQLVLERELVGVSEARKRVLQALGTEFVNNNQAAVANYEAQIEAITEATRLEEQRKQIMQTVESSMESGFMSMVDGTKSVKDAFKDMAREIIKELYRVLVVQRMVGAISGGMGSLGSLFSGPAPGSTASILGSVNANGNAFFGGRVTPFANGGVVNGPTMFPMSGGQTGLMGEAGPEAIMPLKRDKNGRLGVSVDGGSGSVVVNNNINVTGGTDPAAIRMEVAKLMPQITNATKTAVIDARRRGGQMKAAFG